MTANAETITQLAERVGRDHATIRRWIATGVVVDGERVKLLARRVGGRWSITREAWEAFDRACNPDTQAVPESPTELKRRLAADRAEAAKLLG
jgi:hypothetical protein